MYLLSFPHLSSISVDKFIRVIIRDSSKFGLVSVAINLIATKNQIEEIDTFIKGQYDQRLIDQLPSK